MPATSMDRLLARLDESKIHFGNGSAARIEKLLKIFSHRRLPDAASLLRFHEAVLFLRAFPQSPGVLRQTENILADFPRRVHELGAHSHSQSEDASAFDDFEGAGVAGTVMQDVLSFDVARWLVRRLPHEVEIAWNDYEDERALGAVWPRLLPLLEEDAYVEANIPWQQWLRSATNRTGKDLEWLVHAFEQLPVSDRERRDLYDSLRLPLRWKLKDFRFSRTGNWDKPDHIFYHREPLITRNQILLEDELARPAPKLEKVSRREGLAVMEKIREVMAVRYRELYGTTLGDPKSVVRADVERGAVMYMWNLPAQRRLPLRAYVAGFAVKNGVPINYIEAIGLCEWMEVGFNTFYTFRNGETAWVYAQFLRCLVALTGMKCISIYPYQIGQNNDEAIESGAFWFYRKLGFRPGRADLLQLTRQEEEKIARRTGYRTSSRMLKKLAQGHVFFELPGSEPGAWDRFSTRNLGFRVNQRMGREFGGSSKRVRQASVAEVSRALAIQGSRWNMAEQRCLENWATVLALIPDLAAWPSAEKSALAQLVRAQAGTDEMHYLRLTQRHRRLRQELLRLGSSSG
jgi:hypothetical protein